MGWYLPLGLFATGVDINGLGAIVDEKTYLSVVETARAASSAHDVRGPVVLASDIPEFSKITGHSWLMTAYVVGRLTGTGRTEANTVWPATSWYAL